LLCLPSSSLASTPVAVFTLLLAFLAFRAMDITKPWPCMRLQRIPGGWGILLDDLVAGVYAAAIVQIAVAVGLR
jgi:phosphatidylglycerophosphatase A